MSDGSYDENVELRRRLLELQALNADLQNKLDKLQATRSADDATRWRCPSCDWSSGP